MNRLCLSTGDKRLLRRLTFGAVVVLLSSVTALVVATRASLEPVLTEIEGAPGGEAPVRRVVDREGSPLGVSYQGPRNVYDRVTYQEIPELLRQAFVLAEDKRFFEHHGIDWRARCHALLQNVRSLRAVRGASTISEQVVRILRPRPRTLWSRWLEGFESMAMERRLSKDQILELYLNQVPYARERRGVVQAARTYFDRDLRTLEPLEMLTLAVLVRSPSRLDPTRDAVAVRPGVERLARRMHEHGLLSAGELAQMQATPLKLRPFRLDVEATHFVQGVRAVEPAEKATSKTRPLVTTLDSSLQGQVQEILDRRLADLAPRQVKDGAVLVVDHTTDEILAWVNGGGWSEREGGTIDKVLVPRQPGSTLKPFVYGLALEKGWTASTLVDDAPLADAVGHGRHAYRNYSRQFYGPIRVRLALGNSLNIPAVRAARFVGNEVLLDRLRELGFSSLDQHPDYYGDGLALGNGEVSLYELVRAYAALARGGELRSLRRFVGASDLDSSEPRGLEPVIVPRQVGSPTVAAILSDILKDPRARELEFGLDSILRLPIETAVKTGTSNDYRDAWAVGFSSRYVVGVWLGSIDRTEMEEVSGAVGPALVLRSVFHELYRHAASEPLRLDRRLVRRAICAESGLLAGASCPRVDELYRPGSVPQEACYLHRHETKKEGPLIQTHQSREVAQSAEPRIESPTPGLHLARDPRIPDELEAFEFEIAGFTGEGVEWFVDGERVGRSDGPSLSWPLVEGSHRVQARVLSGEAQPRWTQTVGFLVKK